MHKNRHHIDRSLSIFISQSIFFCFVFVCALPRTFHVLYFGTSEHGLC